MWLTILIVIRYSGVIVVVKVFCGIIFISASIGTRCHVIDRVAIVELSRSVPWFVAASATYYHDDDEDDEDDDKQNPASYRDTDNKPTIVRCRRIILWMFSCHVTYTGTSVISVANEYLQRTDIHKNLRQRRMLVR